MYDAAHALCAGVGKQGTEATSDPLANLASGGGVLVLGDGDVQVVGGGGGCHALGGGEGGSSKTRSRSMPNTGTPMKSPRGGGGGSASGAHAGGGPPGGEGVSLGLYLDGARISGVAAGTPAHRAGLQEGDEIKQVVLHLVISIFICMYVYVYVCICIIY